MHEAVLGVGIILPDRRGRALVQRLPERAVSFDRCDVIVAGLKDLDGAADIRSERNRVVLLVAKPRIFNGGIRGGASLHPSLLRGGNQRIAADRKSTRLN